MSLLEIDLKPENILLTIVDSSLLNQTASNSVTAFSKFFYGSPNQSQKANSPSVIVKICDFGVSCKFRKKIMLQDFCGSPGMFYFHTNSRMTV